MSRFESDAFGLKLVRLPEVVVGSSGVVAGAAAVGASTDAGDMSSVSYPVSRTAKSTKCTLVKVQVAVTPKKLFK